ncbi:MAG: hypothetical protein L6R43_18725, partial [Planctomycetes bacterium]|nr:hypothetical protein [Planctomycetota bacterium]
MSGLLALVRLRFREALSGGVLWLVPLHFLLSLAAARAMPGPTVAARREAADGAALALAGLLALLAAVVLGAGPLPAERGRARGALVLAGTSSPAERVLAGALGAGGALLLLLLALHASALGAVEAALGGAPPPRAWVRAISLEGGEPDPRDPALRWASAGAPPVVARFPGPLPADGAVVVEARPRVGRDGGTPGLQRALVRLLPGHEGDPLLRLAAPLRRPFRFEAPAGTREVKIERIEGNFDLGIRADLVRADAGPRTRAESRGLHAMALAGGLGAAMAAALALSTVAGSGVAAAGAGALALLCLFRGIFAEAAATLAASAAAGRALEAGA